MMEQVEDVEEYRDWESEDVAVIKTAVGPALVTGLAECDAVVVRLSRAYTCCVGIVGMTTMLMVIKMRQLPDKEFKIRLLI